MNHNHNWDCMGGCICPRTPLLRPVTLPTEDGFYWAYAYWMGDHYSDDDKWTVVEIKGVGVNPEPIVTDRGYGCPLSDYDRYIKIERPR